MKRRGDVKETMRTGLLADPGGSHGWIEFESLLDDDGSDQYPIERLAQPMLAECTDELKEENP